MQTTETGFPDCVQVGDIGLTSLVDDHAATGVVSSRNHWNAVAGDIDAETARPLVERYFGDAPVGPPITRMQGWVPEREYETREVMYDEVPQARIYRTWVVPGYVKTLFLKNTRSKPSSCQRPISS